MQRRSLTCEEGFVDNNDNSILLATHALEVKVKKRIFGLLKKPCLNERVVFMTIEHIGTSFLTFLI